MRCAFIVLRARKRRHLHRQRQRLIESAP
jgi:hypothetical protein